MDWLLLVHNEIIISQKWIIIIVLKYVSLLKENNIKFKFINKTLVYDFLVNKQV